MLVTHLVKLPARQLKVGIQHGAVLTIRDWKSADREVLFCGVHHLATNDIIVLPQTRQVTVTLFVKVKKVTDDYDQATRAYGVPYTLQ